MPSGGYRRLTAFIFLVNSHSKKSLVLLTMRLAGRLPSLYDRVLADFRLPDGSTVQAWIYTMNHLPEQAEVIPSGDWKAR